MLLCVAGRRASRRVRDDSLPIALRAGLIARFEFQLAAIFHRVGAIWVECQGQIDIVARILLAAKRMARS